MLISTKGRYALRVMIDLAQNREKEQYIPLKDIAARQEISEKYLESIIATLSKEGLVVGVRGKGGGYKLAKDPKAYSVVDILRPADGTLAPVSCLEQGESLCTRADGCKTLPLWKALDSVIDSFLSGVTLADVVDGNIPQPVLQPGPERTQVC